MLTITAFNHGRLAALGEGDVARHVVFVGINLALALLVGARPRWALAPTAVLMVQQVESHGADLLRSVRDPASPFDVVSLGVLVFFPTLIALLVVHRVVERSTPELAGSEGEHAKRGGAPPDRGASA